MIVEPITADALALVYTTALNKAPPLNLAAADRNAAVENYIRLSERIATSAVHNFVDVVCGIELVEAVRIKK